MRTIISLFSGILIFVLILLYSDIEYLTDTKKDIYRALLKPIEWIKDRDLDAYKSTCQKILDGELPLKVHFNAIESVGYGNRMYSVLSSMVFAILTDSVLVLSTWGPDIGKYIDEPFNRTFFNFANIQNGFNAEFKKEEMLVIDDSTVQELSRNSSLSRTILYDIDALFFALCAEKQFYEKLYNYGLVEQSTIDEANEISNENKNYTDAESFKAYFQIGYEVAGNLLNKYWLPNQKLRRQCCDRPL